MAASLLGGTVDTQNAVANGDTRTLSLVHLHTKESGTITFKRDGRYDRAALDQLNWLLRDWRENQSVKMDPRLFDVVWEAQRSLGSSQPLQIVCGYRSPGTNGMLRRRSRGVAEHSQHTQGKAIDFFIPDASIDDLRAAGMRLQRGGVGWYPRSGSPFVHLDIGSVRSWPRMTQDQLARLFPDGKTVHLPANGKPLARYEMAKAEILSRGGTVEGITTIARSDPYDDGFNLKGVFAGLFGRGTASGTSPSAVMVASADQALAYAAPNGTDVLRQAMLRREGGEAPSARALLTGMVARADEGTAAPLPPRRPAEFAGAEAAGATPLPPDRPVQLASLDEGAAGMANTPENAPAPTRLVPADAGSQEQLRSLFQKEAQGASEPSSHSAPIRVALAQVKSGAVPSEVLTDRLGVSAGYFSWRSPGDDLAASRFSGSLTDAFEAAE